MADEPAKREHEMQDEGDASIGAPGVVASKSQAQGGLAGSVIGAVVGAALGLIIGLIFFGDSTRNLVIAVVAFGIAGATGGGTVGGFLWPRRKLATSRRTPAPDK